MKHEKADKSRILEAVHESAQDLYDLGFIDKRALRRYDALCLESIPAYSAEEIRALRERYRISQAVLASILNTSLSTVQKWEIGEKHPGGPSLKLLNILDRKGLDTLIIKAAIAVHQELGPGLLESVYQTCMVIALEGEELNVRTEVPLPVTFRNRVVHHQGFRLDILVEDRIVLELKAVEKIQAVHIKQLLTYLRLADRPLGLLMNFNENLMKNGITRVANGVDI